VFFKIILMTSVTRLCLTTQHEIQSVQDQDKDQDRWTKTKSDGLRPHHLSLYDVNRQ